MDTRDGQLERVEPGPNRWRLRFTRELAHPVEKVWRALTEPEHLKAWFPDDVVGEWAVGRTLRFQPRGDAAAEYPAFEGEILVFDPPSVLEFGWGTDRLRFELEPTGDGTRLVFTDTIDEVGKAARDGAGWHACFDELEHHLDGTQPPWTVDERWDQVHRGYVERFPAEASTIGPPEGRPAADA